MHPTVNTHAYKHLIYSMLQIFTASRQKHIAYIYFLNFFWLRARILLNLPIVLPYTVYQREHLELKRTIRK